MNVSDNTHSQPVGAPITTINHNSLSHPPVGDEVATVYKAAQATTACPLPEHSVIGSFIILSRCAFGPNVCGLAVASTSKSLVQINKSLDVGRAIEKGSALCLVEREGPNCTLNPLCLTCPGQHVSPCGRGLFRPCCSGHPGQGLVRLRQ